MSVTIWGPMITGAITLLFSWLLATGLRTGAIELPQFGLNLSGRRSDQPVRFWLVTLLVGIITAVCALATMAQIFFPHGL